MYRRRRSEAVTARDNGQSAYVNGLSYWFFDDTMTTNSFIDNTAAVTSDLDASNNIDLQSADWTSTTHTGTPGQTIPPTQAETNFQNAHATSTGCTGSTDAFCGATYALWPGAVLADPNSNRILVGYQKLCRGSQGSSCASTALAGQVLGWGWYETVLSLGLGARLEPSTGGLTDATGVADPALFGGPNGVEFTTGAVSYNGYAYLYGGGNVLTGSYLARVPLNDFTNMAAWTYWDGSSYQSDVSKVAGTITPGAAGNTIFYSAALGGFYNVFMPFGSSTAYMQSASVPEGPWSSDVEIFTSVTSNGQTNYACFAHPEYASADGLTQYISYYQPGSGAQRLVKVVLN
ncbi:hypothetical protein PENSPDRAFT_368086 [Peniophora sp. CONT]|nr:hypothetical protein PENSPDRAFT_368086 [Peniophora sp. CONT]